jgi:ADP-dependent NAD(P)H-hydrate dehydratase / NAD(P)H-hydrate epimerase
MDGNSPHHGVSLSTLMENAAKALADEIGKRRARRILILCGPGNNGGDGLALIRHLPPTIHSRVLLAKHATQFQTPEAKAAAAGLDPCRHPLEVFRTVERLRELARDSDLIVDALLGSGIQGALREPIATMVRAANAARKPILAVDVPTGIGTPLAIRPTWTVALHDRKEGMTRANSGQIVVRDIGIPATARTDVGPADFVIPFRQNAPDSHKGQNGRVLVVAGGPYLGAPILAAQGALRAGADLVRLYTPRDGALVAQAAQTDLIVHPSVHPARIVPEDRATVSKLLSKVDVVLVGPGLGDHAETVEATLSILEAARAKRVKAVLDADALAAVGSQARILARQRAICTPHAGEFLDLTGRRLPTPMKARTALVRKEAARLGVTILAKGPVDVIADGRRWKHNHVHHPAMTVGGTGDVLAGLAAGFYARGMEPFHAACAAAFVNGDAGQAVARRQGGTLVASDLVQEIPQVFQRWLARS